MLSPRFSVINSIQMGLEVILLDFYYILCVIHMES